MDESRGAARRGPLTAVLRSARRLGVVVLGVLCLATVSLGALSTPLPALLIACPVLALITGTLYVPAHRARLHETAPRHQVVAAAFTGAGVLPFVSGAELLGVFGAVLTLAVVAVAVLLVSAHLHVADPFRVPRRLRATAVCTDIQGGATGTDEAALRALLRRAPLPALFRRWHGTGRTVDSTRSGRGYETAVYLRGLLLDELHERDPAGTQRWIEQGGAQPPERHIRDGRALPG